MANAPQFYFIKQALRSYFCSEVSVQDAEDPALFRAQMLLNDHSPDDDLVASTSNVINVLVGVSAASYVAQLAVIVYAWHLTGTNPLRFVPIETLETSIDTVTAEFTSQQRIFDVSFTAISSFVAAADGGDDRDTLMATTMLVNDIGGARGLLTLLGFRQTVGSRTVAPLTFHQCLAAFAERHTVREPLTVGARAFSKHCTRSLSGWWGEYKGNDAAKNIQAETKVRDLLATATWKNIHSLPHAHATMEIRNLMGYGARWDTEIFKFRGFLEPPMLNGHAIKWRHL
ncbi:hypothetical protein CCR75_008245 [Bremia lactucae]|uniref:Uncharacterized protein n=1 Tax=Bremia lactucae TaxID=4779 RepID=A0A976ICX2_BRELC|nr:hypothetical protein CCR75_008245 [Bremia lactucae]